MTTRRLLSSLARLPGVPLLPLTLALAASLAACANGTARDLPVAATTATPVGDWQLISLAGQAASGPSLSLAEVGRVSGHAGCNRYSADAQFDNRGRFSVGPVMATKMACQDDRMEAEIAFLRMLDTARSYRRADDGLQLLAEDGRVLAQFERGTDGN